jgi:ATP-dependent DNA helicase RecG
MLADEQLKDFLTLTESERVEQTISTLKSAKFKTFDVIPCSDATVEQLDLEIFQNTYRRKAIEPEVIQENHRDLTIQLAALRFYHLGKNCPTNAGAIVFGKDPLNYFPGAYVQFVRFDGESLGDEVAEQKQFKGNLIVLLRELNSFVNGRFTQKPVKISALREQLIWDFPEDAVRELLINSILHRDYQSNQPVRFYQFSNRIEIQNSGGLYGDARPENFPRVNDYRNPVLAEAIAVLGYANRFGRGVARAQKLLAENGSFAATFNIETTHFLATIPKHPDR